MSNLKKFAVIGSRTINNYYIVYSYLKQYLPKDAIIVTGGAQGVDMLAEVYAEMNGHPCEVYEAKWDIFGKSAGMRRNVDMARNSTHCFAFWDGKSPGTKHCIEEMKKRNVKTIIIDVTDEDILRPHPGRVVHVNKDPFDVYIGKPTKNYIGILSNPFQIDANHDRRKTIAMFCDYLMKNQQMLNDLISLKDRKSSIDDGPVKLGCWCAESENGPLCHGDMICWLLDHAFHDMLKLAGKIEKQDESQNYHKTSPQSQEEIFSKWNENGESVQVSTTTGLALANGYSAVVQDEWKRWFLQVPHFDIVRNHIHKSLAETKREEEEEPAQCYWVSNDRCKIQIIQPMTEFDGSPFKKGYWYIRINDQLTK